MRVVGDEDEVVREGDRRDHQVVGADHRAGRAKVGAKPALLFRRRVVERQGRKALQEETQVGEAGDVVWVRLPSIEHLGADDAGDELPRGRIERLLATMAAPFALKMFEAALVSRRYSSIYKRGSFIGSSSGSSGTPG